MKKVCAVAAVLWAAGVSAPAQAQAPVEETAELPEAVRVMLDASRQTGDLVRVTWVALQAYPQFVDDIFDYSGVDPTVVQDEIVVLGKPETLEALASASGMTPEEYASSVPITSPFWDPQRWDGQIDVGASAASGNSNNKNASFAIRARRKHGRFASNFNSLFEINRQEGETNKQRVQLGYQFDADLTARTFAFGRTEFVDDRFTGFDYRIFAVGGLGRRLFEGDRFQWTVDGGPGYRRSALLNSPVVRDEFSFRGASDLVWEVSEFSTLRHTVSTLVTTETSTLESDIALITDISSHISTRLSYSLRYETQPPPGAQSTDMVTRASLLFEF